LKTVVDRAIVLRRINYGEADRIVSVLTANNGKVSFLAKGVRKSKSKLAAGIEPFCVNEICFAPGRGELATLTSSRLLTNYTDFINQLEKLELANYILKSLDSHLEENASSSYFELLETAIYAINNTSSAQILELWWLVNILKISGNDINTFNQVNGESFKEKCSYELIVDKGGFIENINGQITPSEIKLIKLAKNNNPDKLILLKNYEAYCSELLPILRSFYRYHTSGRF